VDDAIVFLENCVRRMEKFGESPGVAALRGAQEISFTIFSMTIALAAVFLPLLLLLAPSYGGMGAASVWLAMNAAYFIVGTVWTHRQLLIGDAWRWLGVDVGLPAAAAFVMVGALSRLPSFSGDRLQMLLRLGGMCVAALVAAAFAAPRMRTGVLKIAGVRP